MLVEILTQPFLCVSLTRGCTLALEEGRKETPMPLIQPYKSQMFFSWYTNCLQIAVQKAQLPINEVS